MKNKFSLLTFLLLFTMGIGQMWGADPQDTYYKFTATANPGASINPISGDGGSITLGTNSNTKVVSSTALYMGSTYSYAAVINNDASTKSLSLNISASTTNPAHVFILVTSDSRTIKLKNGSSDIDQCGVRGTAGTSSITEAAALVELISTKSGTHYIYASGSANVYAVRVVYEKNDLWQEIKGLTNVTLDKDKTLADDLSTLYFFRMQDLRFDNANSDVNKRVINFGNSVSNGLRYTINFKAQKDGTVTIKYANPGTSSRTLTVTTFTRPTTAGSPAIISQSVGKGTTTYADKEFNVVAGTEYVISFGSGATIKSVNFTAAPSSFTLSAAVAEASAGYGTVSASSITNIAKDAAITINNNTLTVGSTTITATPTTQSAQYTYAFANWKLANGDNVPAKVTADLSVVANFTRTPRSYGVTLNTNEGTINAGNVTSYTFGTETTLPTNVTKENNDFKGWYASSDFSTERVYTIAADATGNKEYWAKWEAEAPKHDISYTNLKGQSVTGYPTQYSEGEGIASFEPLSDVEGFHFTGWDPEAIPADATADPFEVEAQWVPTFTVTYNLNGGSGTTPTESAKYEGEVFTLATQGDIVAPSGKAFDGWKANGAGDKLAAGSEYTMGNDDVEFVVKWKNIPTIIYHYQWTGSGTAPTVNSALTATGGTFTFYKSPSSSKDFTTASVTYHTGVSSDMKTVAGTSDKLVALNSTSNNSYLVTLTGNKYFAEGDTVFFAGYGNFRVGTTHGADDVVAASSALETGSGASDVNVGYFIFPELENVNTLYFTRDATSGNRGFTAVKVIRPAAKEVVSTVNTLTDVKVNGTSISAANLAKLVSEHSLALSDELVSAPTITFNKHTVITYDDNSNKVTDTPIEVTATVVEGKWSASTTFDAVTYTVTLVKLESYAVTYAAGGGAGEMTDSNSPYVAGAEVTLLANAFTAPTDKEFDAWVVTKTNGGASVTVTDGKFIMPAEAVTVTASWKDITYAVTYHANGATGTVPTDANAYAANAKVTVLGKGDLARLIETEAATFYGWNTKADMSGTRYEADAKFDMPAADVDLYAVWGYAIEYNLDDGTINDANYATWYYSDGATTSITTALPSNVTKDDYTFVGWYTHNGIGEKVTSVNAGFYGAFAGEWALKAVWKPSYASSINIEQWVLDNGKEDATFQALMATKGYTLNNVNSLDSLDDTPGKSNRNYAYMGQKLKAAGASISFTLKAGKTVKVRIGNVGAAFNIYEGETATSYTADDLRNTKPTDSKVYTYTATEDIDIKIENVTKDKTLVIKQIMIDEDIEPITLPWKVTYNFNDGETPTTSTAIWTGSALTLPDATAPADYTFAGWYDELLGGELKGAAGASYTPTDNVTLFAHYAPDEYAVAYDGNGATSGSMSASAAGWGTLVTPAANAFEKTGNIFAGWVITKTSDGSATGITFSDGKFEMPKYAVTLVAQWEDVSKVAVVVETNVKYESLAEAIAAAEPGYTVQLIQDIEQATGVAIAKNLVLDLNGHTFTCTDGANVNSRAIKITAGDVTVKNGTIAAVTTANFEGGCYGAFRIEGATANVTLRDLTMTNGRHYGLGIKLVNGHLDMEDCTVTSINGAGGLEVGTGTALVKNCTFTQSGFENAHAWIATCLATCYMGNLEVQGGTYTSEHYVLYVYSSGGAMDVKSGTFEGDIRTAMDLNSYPTAEGSIEIEGGSFQGVGGAEINFAATTDKDEIAISAGTFNTPIENQYCAEGYVPSAEVAPGEYTVVPKDGVEIIGVVVTGNTEGTVSGLYKGSAEVNLNNKKIDSGKYIYVTLKEGYTFEESDVLIVDVNAKSNLDGGNKALEITTGVGNIDGDVWKSIAFDDYSTGENIIPLTEIAAGQTSIGLKRSANQNAKINGLRVLRPMKPMLTAITIDERAGEIDPLDDKHFNVTIPFEAELDALTVEPEIVWNEAAASDSIVVNDGSAWVLGDNTYKLTDKDNDYTVYTITLTRDVQKFTVTFNAQGGSTVQPELVVAGEKLTAAPADPTKEDHIFLGWALATEGEVVEVTDIVIDENKTFYAQWQDEHPIKLIQADTINTKDFITGATMPSSLVEVDGINYHYALLGGTASSPSGQNQLNKFITYNATTTQTKVMVDVFNTATSARQVVIKGVVEGSATITDIATIDMDNGANKHVKSLYYSFDNAANRTIYISVPSSVNTVDFLQVRIIESGEPLKKFGESGYSINFNQGRLYGPSATDLKFEGMTYNLGSNYNAVNSTTAVFKKNTSYQFKVSAAVTMTIEASKAQYYVATTSDGTTNLTNEEGAHKFNLTAGTWYLIIGGSNLNVTKISFSDEEPVYTRENLNPANIGTLCVKYNGRLEGATLYELNGKNEYNKLVFDEVENNVMVAGRPYIFVPENGNTKIEVYKSNEEFAEEAGSFHGMQGTFVALSTITDGMNSPLWGNYIISNNKYIYVDADNCSLKENRAYILSLDQVPDETPAEPNTNGSPRRRVVMGGNPAPSVVTGFDNLNEAEAPMKVMIDGQLFIIRGEKMFDATGRLVK